ncbi:MAG: helix-turn-helix transcriptional regulator [Gemmatimonadota bacterium]
MRRYAKEMLAIERTTIRLLGEHLEHKPQGIYGYELAEILREETSTTPTAAADAKSFRDNGTIYKILYRLGRIGAVTSYWEEPEVALEEGRPRRRYYLLTENGRARARNIGKVYWNRRRQGLPETDPRTLG